LTQTRGVEHPDIPPLTYANYLDLEKLLTPQKPRSQPAEHDGMLSLARLLVEPCCVIT